MSSLITRLTGAFRLIRIVQILLTSAILFAAAYLWRGWIRAGCDVPDRLLYNTVVAVISAILLPLSLWGTSFLRTRSRFLRTPTASPKKSTTRPSLCSVTSLALLLDFILLLTWLSLTLHHTYPCSNVCERCTAPSLLAPRLGPRTSSEIANLTRSASQEAKAETALLASTAAAPPTTPFYVWSGTTTCSCYGASASEGNPSALRKLAATVLRKFKGTAQRPGHDDPSTRIIASESYGKLRIGLDGMMTALCFMTLVITGMNAVDAARGRRRKRGWEEGVRLDSAGRVPRLSVYYVPDEKLEEGRSGSPDGQVSAGAVGR